MVLLFDDLVDPRVAVTQTVADVSEPARPEEESGLDDAHPARLAEFRTTRWCARRSLRALGQEAGAVPRGEHGEPRWPAGFVGSLTHCAGLRAAAVASDYDIVALGIDAEQARTLEPRAERFVTGEAEREQLRDLERWRPAVPWNTLMFSCKEATFKLWFPVTGAWLGFQDARVTLRRGGTFGVRLAGEVQLVLNGRPTAELEGHWFRSDDHVGAVIAVEARPTRAADRAQASPRVALRRLSSSK